MLLEWTLFTKQLDTVWVVLNNFLYNQVHLRVNYEYIVVPLSYRCFFIIGHIAGGFARHRYDLKIQMQQQAAAAAAAAAAALAAQQQATDKSMTSVSRGDTTNGGVIHHLAHQPRASSSTQRASTSLSAMR